MPVKELDVRIPGNGFWEAASRMGGEIDASRCEDWIVLLTCLKEVFDVFNDEMTKLVGSCRGRAMTNRCWTKILWLFASV